MEKYLLFIKSIINQGAYFKGSAIIDFYLRRFSNKYYYLVFLFSLIFFAFIVVSSLGIASENKIKFNVSGQQIDSVNFLKFAIILTLQTILWKTIASGINKQDHAIMNIIKLHSKNKKDKISIFFKTIFFNGFSFRILFSGLACLSFVVYSYFPEDFFINLIISTITLIGSIFLILSIECLLFYIQTFYKLNSSVFTIVFFVLGFVVYNYLDQVHKLNLFHLITFICICMVFYLSIRNFIKQRL